jgi:hypothetical protein
MQRVAAIMIAAFWPLETIYIAVGTDQKAAIKIGEILALLAAHFLIIVWILFLSELLQAFLDIAKNTQETAESISVFSAGDRARLHENQEI